MLQVIHNKSCDIETVGYWSRKVTLIWPDTVASRNESGISCDRWQSQSWGTYITSSLALLRRRVTINLAKNTVTRKKQRIKIFRSCSLGLRAMNNIRFASWRIMSGSAYEPRLAKVIFICVRRALNKCVFGKAAEIINTQIEFCSHVFRPCCHRYLLRIRKINCLWSLSHR